MAVRNVYDDNGEAVAPRPGTSEADGARASGAPPPPRPVATAPSPRSHRREPPPDCLTDSLTDCLMYWLAGDSNSQLILKAPGGFPNQL